uniref:Retrotransposon protein, putative, Ty1-copia subclass n=2 Tax=Oryza sativa subsp. japonica TaxID=39947 RepID=Q851U4_ORYSJ|nr:putative copia-type retrotransposon protein [Oryza sativa Japonica Group]ABF96850.1 retrotransposon protein, putative, Ty1-copia subclass [Oryza sativa Japonica Group]
MSNEVNHVGKAPMFNGTNYSTWKIKMSTHLKAMSFHIWSIVDVGFAITGTPLTEIDHRNLQLNAQAMNALFNSLSQEEFDRVSNLESTYEIWNKLAEIHEGTSEYKDAKLHFLEIQYETFSMLPHESVNDMYGRLNVIVNDLKGLGANYNVLEVAQKMLRALPEKYETLVTMLINSDMSRMTLASLLGKINTNDMYKLKKKEMEEASPSKKCIVLQAEVEDKGKGKVNEANEDLEEEIVLLARRFNDLLGRRKERRRGSNSNRRRNRRPNKTLSNLRCFECGEKGHFASKCPSKDDDADNSASSGSEEEGGDDASSKKKKMAVVAIKEAPSLFAPLCLMAKGSSKVTSLSDSESDDDCDDVFYDELVSMFEELHAYSEKEIVKFKALKKDHASLEVLYEELKTSHERLTISHEKLKEAHDNLLSTTQHGALIDVGISCDLLDDSATCHIAHVASSSISTSCDDLVDMPSSSPCVSICDASLVENNELKEQVAKLNKNLERCFKGKNTLDKILSEQRCILNKEGLGFIPKKGKKPSHRASRFVKNNGKYCSKCREVGNLVNYCTGGSHWVLDSGCTQHMTGDRAMFSTFEVEGNEQEKVTFGDNSKGKMNAMHEELNNFARNKVWTLVERPRDHNVIGTKWIFKNKQDENGLVVRNKARLVAQGFTQVEGLDFGETFAPVARLEAIRILLAFASCFDIKLFQMDVKSAFLNGEIAELVFVEQPPGFEDPKNPNHVYKLSKSPRAWEFEMSMIGELSFFLGLQIKQLKDGTFVSQTKYIKDLLKRFSLEDAKPIKTLLATNGHLDLDERVMPPLTRHGHRAPTPDPVSKPEESSGDDYAQSDEEVEANVEGASGEASGDDVSGSGEDEDEGSDDMNIDPSIQFVVNMRNPLQYTILRHHDQFLRPRDTPDPRFHTAFQKSVYEQVYAGKAFAEHKWISWRDIKETPEFESLQDLFKTVGIDRIVTLKQDYNEDLIRQFYAIVWVAGDYSEMKWMSDTLQCSISRRQLRWLLNIRLDFGDGLHEEHTHNSLSIDYLCQFYEDGARYTHGKVDGLRTIPSVVNKIVRATILPRLGNNDDIRGVAWHVIDAIIQGRQFDIVSLMMQEIAISKGIFTQGIYYAPYIMRLIQDKLGAAGQNLKKHKQYKPRLQLGAPRAPRTVPSSHPGASSSSAPPSPPGYDPNAFFHP